jgi:aspartyl-tRNA(Asn)/glutamyl-tRNA(Gln) amidotransferase subunit C
MKFDIDHIAELARLYLTPKEKKTLGPQLKAILTFVGKIAKVETDRISPTFQTTGLKDVIRDDKVEPCQSLTPEEALANAPRKKNDFFKVKRVSKTNP